MMYNLQLLAIAHVADIILCIQSSHHQLLLYPAVHRITLHQESSFDLKETQCIFVGYTGHNNGAFISFSINLMIIIKFITGFRLYFIVLCKLVITTSLLHSFGRGS